MSRPSRRDRARVIYAGALLARGRQWANLAESIRSGFENQWVTPALDAIERLVLLSGDDEGDDIEAVAA